MKGWSAKRFALIGHNDEVGDHFTGEEQVGVMDNTGSLIYVRTFKESERLACDAVWDAILQLQKAAE